jgi:hypothetical protein
MDPDIKLNLQLLDVLDEEQKQRFKASVRTGVRKYSRGTRGGYVREPDGTTGRGATV